MVVERVKFEQRIRHQLLNNDELLHARADEVRVDSEKLRSQLNENFERGKRILNRLESFLVTDFALSAAKIEKQRAAKIEFKNTVGNESPSYQKTKQAMLPRF